MRAYWLGTVLIAGSLALAGCGESPGCRALTGGVAGAAAGGLTSPDQVSAGPSPVCD